jgi:WD40 repeat protein
MTAVATASQLDSENPWPGLESFQENAHDYFFGRHHETDSLLNHVRDASVTVLYGRSGLGKTSLLRAGLFPALREENLLPIYVRLELKQGSVALSHQLLESVRDSIHANVPDALLPADDESLWEYLHRKDFELWSAQNYPLKPVIVLDQFEELFTLGERVPDLVRQFMNDLGDLAENRIPADVAALIDDDEAEAGRFQLRSHNYKLLITLREDFLPHLEEWCQLIPALRRSRVRLLPLSADKAFDAVYKPADGLMSAPLAERVVRIVAGEEIVRSRDSAGVNGDRNSEGRGTSSVEPALLSLFCRELNEERKRQARPEFDEELVENAKRDILSNYYLSCVRDLPPRVAEFIESELITEKGFRDSYAREDAVPSRLSEAELTQLISSRLLRLEEYHGAQRIELTHDVLTGVVREHRDRRRAEEEKSALAQAAERHAAELDNERKASRGLRKQRAALALLCVVAVVAAIMAVVYAHSAGVARNDAEAEWLYGHAQLMLTGQSPSSGGDETAIQMMLAAHTIDPAHDSRNYELLTALDQEPDLLKVIHVTSIAEGATFSPDGSRVVTGGDDGTVRLWDAVTGKQVWQTSRGDGLVSSVAFSPDGSHIASAGTDKMVRLWNAVTGEQVWQASGGNEGVLNDVAFSPDGTRIASAGADKTVRLWDAVKGDQIGEPFTGHTDWVRSVAFSPDGRRIVSGGDDKTVRLWDAVKGDQIGELTGHTDYVMTVAFSPNGSRIASAGRDKTVRLWDSANLEPVGKPLTLDYSVNSIAFSPDSTRLVTGGTGKAVQLWDADSQQEAGVLVGHESGVTGLAFSSDGQRVVSTSGDRTVRIWDAVSWQPIASPDEFAVAWFSSDGRGIYSGGKDGSVRRWDSITKRPIGDPQRLSSTAVSGLYPFGENRLLSTEADSGIKTLRVWARNGDPISPPLTVMDDNGGSIIAKTDEKVLKIFDAVTARPIGVPMKHGDPISAFNVTSDGRFVATAGSDGTAHVWDGRTGAPVGAPMKRDAYVFAVALSPDGSKLAASYSDFTLRLWDTATGKTIGEPMDTHSVAYAIAFTPDGRIVASGSDDGTIRLWDADNQTQLGAAYKDHTRAVSSLYFNNDGKKLVSASSDHTIRVWPVPSPSADAARDLLCSRLSQNMANKKWKDLVPGDVDYVAGCQNLPEAEGAG